MPRGKVSRVIDGDTFVLRGGEHVRIANLNAPELGQKGGQAAKRGLQNQMPKGTSVGLSKPLARSYGRIVRRVSVKGQVIKGSSSTSPKRRKRR